MLLNAHLTSMECSGVRPQSTRITLKIRVSESSTKFVIVRASQTVGVLNSLFENEERCFVFNEQILLNCMSFGFYNLCDNDTILAYPIPVFSPYRDIAFTNYGNMSYMMQMVAASHSLPELARLRDLHLTRIERRTKSFRRYCHLSTDYENNLQDKAPVKHDTVIKNSEMPSVDPLPICWSEVTETAPTTVEQEPLVPSIVWPESFKPPSQKL